MARRPPNPLRRSLRPGALGLALALLSGGAGAGSPDWYYHWNCHGDYECLTTNAWGQPSGTADEGPNESDCLALMNFAAHFWGPGATNSCDHSSSGPTVVRIVVSPATASIAKGRSQAFTAQATYSDGYAEDVTGSAAWAAGTPAVAHLMGATAFGDAVGTTSVTATLGPASGSATLTVTAAVLQSITVTPAYARIAKGLTQQFTATGHYSDGSSQDLTAQVAWSSSLTAVATFAAGGLATAAGAGTTTVIATLGTMTGSTQLSVTAAQLLTIDVTPHDPTLPIGVTQQLTATGHYTDGSQVNLTAQVTWASDTPAAATVSAGGLATPVAPGATTITATLGAVVGSTGVTVTAAALQAIAVAPPAVSLPVGFTQPFTATGSYSDGSTQDLTASASWASGNPAAASVAAGGVATTAAPGTATISASVGAVTGAATLTVTSATLTSIAITPANPTLTTGTTRQLAATGSYSDGSFHDVTALATWSSSSSAVATVSAAGLASALAAGATTVSAKVGAVTGSTPLTVAPPGVVWTVRAGGAGQPSLNALYAVASSGALFTAVSPGTIETSPDGVAWTSQPTDGGYYLRGVAWDGGNFVAVGYWNTGAESMALVGSPDGTAWTGYGWTTPPGVTLLAVAWTFRGGVAVGTSGAIWTAASPAGWTGRTSGTAAGLYGVGASGSIIVAVGQGGTILTSVDGTSWTPRTSPTGSDLSGVTWTGTQFVAVGAGGTVLTSPDGVTWTARSSGTGAGLNAVASSGALTVAVGDSGTALTSPDGITWSPATSGTSVSLYGVAWSGRQFAAVGGGTKGIVLTSP